MRPKKKEPEALAGAARARSIREPHPRHYRTRYGDSNSLLPLSEVVSLYQAARACRADAEAHLLEARPTHRRSLLLDAVLRQEELARELLELRRAWEAAA